MSCWKKIAFFAHDEILDSILPAAHAVDGALRRRWTILAVWLISMAIQLRSVYRSCL